MPSLRRASAAAARRRSPVAERVLWPVSPLAGAASVGLVNITADHAGTPRYVPLLIASGADLLPSFVLRTAAVAAEAEPELEATRPHRPSADSVDFGYDLPLRFYGPRGTVATVSAQAVLDFDADAGATVRGRVVVVGATAIGTADTFATAFDPVLPGVELSPPGSPTSSPARGLVRNGATRRLDLAASVLLPIVTVLAFTLRRVGLGVALCAVPLVLWFAFATSAFTRDYWFAMAVPLAATLPPALVFGGVRLLARAAQQAPRAAPARGASALSRAGDRREARRHAGVPAGAGAAACGGALRRLCRASRPERAARPARHPHPAQGVPFAGRGGGDAARRFRPQLHGRRRDAALRPAGAEARRRAARRRGGAEARGGAARLDRRARAGRLGASSAPHRAALRAGRAVAARARHAPAHPPRAATPSTSQAACSRSRPKARSRRPSASTSSRQRARRRESGALPAFAGAREIAIRGRARPLAVSARQPCGAPSRRRGVTRASAPARSRRGLRLH